MLTFQNLPKDWDLVVVGGGITGAGILNEATRAGLRTLLLEKQDYAWGTSSRSSKLVHGGLRYLRQGKFTLTLSSVRERERLLKETTGLVRAQDFIVPIYDDFGPGKWTVEAGLTIYDLMAGEKQHRYLDRDAALELEPNLRPDYLVGCFVFKDAEVDDARLVTRLIFEAVVRGGAALNYTGVEEVLRDREGSVAGVAVRDAETGLTAELSCKAVVNATGAWVETLHLSPESGRYLRPLRGSHVFFPLDKIPVKNAVSFAHPFDERPIFVRPWEGVAVAGTTDVDHDKPLDVEPYISSQEAEYLMDGIEAMFPGLPVTLSDAVSSMAGVRPVFGTGQVDPSRESREHVLWEDNGLFTVTGGKLTTFRVTARETLKSVLHQFPGSSMANASEALFFTVRPLSGRKSGPGPEILKRLYGRYGHHGAETIVDSPGLDLESVPGTDTIWAELAYCARHEQVRHLTDLLLRRTRIGLLCKNGGRALLDRVHQVCAPHLPWNGDKWEREKRDYLDIWQKYYAPPADTRDRDSALLIESNDKVFDGDVPEIASN